MIELFEAEVIEIHIDWSGQKVWINTEKGCQFRAYRIKNIVIQDDRNLEGDSEG